MEELKKLNKNSQNNSIDLKENKAKIKELDLDLKILIGRLMGLDKWNQKRDYEFYLKVLELLRKSQEILSGNEEHKGLLKLVWELEEKSKKNYDDTN